MADDVAATRAEAKAVLLIEDSKTQALHLRSLLEGQGLRVLVAGVGQDGLHIARTAHPDLIVLDIEMPDIDGFEVCRQLKATADTASIPVIMLTRHDDVRSVLSGLETGAIDYIPKDVFADSVLLETLRQMGIVGGEDAATTP